MGVTAGNASEAARMAGYAVPMQEGYRLLRNADIQIQIDLRTSDDGLVASREERQRWWTAIMRGQVPGTNIKDRLKAAELLGKTQGDFVARLRVEGRVNHDSQSAKQELKELLDRIAERVQESKSEAI